MIIISKDPVRVTICCGTGKIKDSSSYCVVKWLNFLKDDPHKALLVSLLRLLRYHFHVFEENLIGFIYLLSAAFIFLIWEVAYTAAI